MFRAISKTSQAITTIIVPVDIAVREKRTTSSIREERFVGYFLRATTRMQSSASGQATGFAWTSKTWFENGNQQSMSAATAPALGDRQFLIVIAIIQVTIAQ
jgi:hypothetical protein